MLYCSQHNVLHYEYYHCQIKKFSANPIYLSIENLQKPPVAGAPPPDLLCLRRLRSQTPALAICHYSILRCALNYNTAISRNIKIIMTSCTMDDILKPSVFLENLLKRGANFITERRASHGLDPTLVNGLPFSMFEASGIKKLLQPIISIRNYRENCKPQKVIANELR